MDVLRLTVRTTDQGDWNVQLGTPSTRSVEGGVPAEVVNTLHSQAEALRAPVIFARPDLDPWLTHLEEQFGRALGAALLGDPVIAGAWARHAGRAEAREAIRVVMLDADERSLALPWELLAEGADRAPMEAEGTGTVVILGDGAAKRPPAGPLVVEVLSDAPEEPLVGALRPTVAPAFEGPCRRLVHLVEHGTDQGFGLALGSDASRGMGTAVHGYHTSLSGAWLVNLAVCESGARASLAVQRVLSAGGLAVLAPTDRLATEVAEVVGTTLAEVAPSGTLIEAVTAARRAVRLLARPYPDARWYRLRLTVSSTRGLLASPVRAEAAPVPAKKRREPRTVSRDSLFARARVDAEASLMGFLGIEHLLLALGDAPETSSQLRYAVSKVDLRARFGAWRLISEQQVLLTPRLAHMLEACPNNASVAVFETQLRTHAAPVLSWLLGATALHDLQEGTFATAHTTDGAPAVTALEVLGGPEDGRRISLRRGGVVGRWSESLRADAVLYQHTALTDPRLSRAHLGWDGVNVTALAPFTRVRGTRRIKVAKGSSCELHVGDVVLCSEVTVLQAVGPLGAPD